MPRQRAKSASVTDVQADPSDHTVQAHNVTIGQQHHDDRPESDRIETVRHNPQSAINRISGDEGAIETEGTQRYQESDSPGIEQPEPLPAIEPEPLSASKTPEKPTDEPRKLSPREKRFLDAYEAFGFCNGRDAYYQACNGSQSREACSVSASRLLREPHIQSELTRRFERLAPNPSELLGDLALTARVDPAELGTLYTEDEHGRRRVDWDQARSRGVSRLIKHVSLNRSGHETIEWHDPMKARELLARIMGLTKDNASISVNVESLSIDELKAIVNG